MKEIHCFDLNVDLLVNIFETKKNKVPVIPADEFACNYLRYIDDPEKYFSTIPKENVMIISGVQLLSGKHNVHRGIIELAKYLPNPHGLGGIILQSDIKPDEIDFCPELTELIKHDGILMDYNKVFDNVKELHKFNFTEVIKHKDYSEQDEPYSIFNATNQPQKGNYSFGISGCCHECEIEEWNVPDKDKDEKEEYKDYKLCYVSHGSHSFDFLSAANVDIENDCVDWNDTPVLFLMENPSVNDKDYPFYEQIEINEHEKKYIKYPTNTWYWIHNKKRPVDDMQNDFESYLKQSYYGEMAYALICKYKLANAYLTNVIKCGMNPVIDEKVSETKKPSYLGTWWYYDGCKKTCIEKVLKQEILNLTKGYDRLVVFAFGNNAYWLVKDFLQNTDNEKFGHLKNIQLALLPHPSSRLNNTFRRILLSDYVEKVITDKDIDKIESNNNLLKTDDDLKKLKNIIETEDNEYSLKKYHFNEEKRWFDSKNPKQVLKIKTDKSLFSREKRIMKEIVFYTTERKHYGYQFFDKYFWAWDESEKDYIEESEYETDEYFISFKKALEGNGLL